jgi:2,3-bisphosphoglycerate-dependent phosphoglycerate mutase
LSIPVWSGLVFSKGELSSKIYAVNSDNSKNVPGPFGGLDTSFLTDIHDATELLLVRHGQQEVDYHRATVGELNDPALSRTGREQARLVGERFKDQRIDVVYASPLSRAFDTANQVALHHALEPIVDPDVREVEIFRDADPSKQPAEIFGRQKMLGVRRRMQREQSWDVYPQSEGSAEFRGRVVTAIEGIVADHDGQRVVVGCHGGVICAYLGWVLGIDRDLWFRAAHSSVNIIRAKGLVRSLVTVNDFHHLPADLVTY